MKKIILTEVQKKTLKISFTVLEAIILILTVAMSIFTIISANNGSSQLASGLTKVSYLPVLSDSMSPAIDEGDLIIAKKPEDVNALKLGDIITFKTIINGENEINTHRIIEITSNDIGDQIIYITHGDNAPEGVNEKVYSGSVLAVYNGRIKNVGSIILWLQKPANFFIVIMIPLLLLFLYNGYTFAKVIINMKLKKALAEQGKNKLTEEEIKKLAVEEYIAREKAENKQ